MTENVRQRVVRAAQDNRTEAVRLMLESGWPIDVRGEHRGTPLHFAAWNGNVEMVCDLLHRHAPVDVRGDEFDLSPLGWALHGSRHCSFKNTGDYAGVVRSLLRAGATPPSAIENVDASKAVKAELRRL